jgi:DNA-binding NarL/FixJ family response regulator
MTDGNGTRLEAIVLIVEDNALMRRTLRDFLQHAFPDYGFREAADGVTALEACNAHPPNLVLMDVCLPDADGIDLTARLLSSYPGLRVIVVSHWCGDIYVQRALAAGARAYLLKDNLATELIPAVAAAIGVTPATDTGASW